MGAARAQEKVLLSVMSWNCSEVRSDYSRKVLAAALRHGPSPMRLSDAEDVVEEGTSGMSCLRTRLVFFFGFGAANGGQLRSTPAERGEDEPFTFSEM